MSRGGLTRTERDANERRRRALAHLERRQRSGETLRLPRLPGTRPLLIVFGLALLLGVWIGGRPLAPAAVEKISVAGAVHLAPEAIARAAGLAPDVSAPPPDRRALAERLGRHAWIAEARALALPGGRVVLGVTEREPVAVLLADDVDWAVDAAGVPFATAPAGLPAELPRIHAAESPEPGRADPAIAEALALLRTLPEHGLPAPSEISLAPVADPEGVSLRLPTLRARIVLGRGELAPRVAELARLVSEGLPGLGDATQVDLRFGGQAVLDFEPLPEGAAQAAAKRGRATSS